MKLIRSSMYSMFLCVTAVLLLANAHAALPVAVDGQQLPSLAPMLERVQKSMVKLDIETAARKRSNDPFFNDPFFRRFIGQRHTKVFSGSGIVIDAQRGLILTNEHAIDRAKSILVTLDDGRQVKARVLGQDKVSDVAVLQIDSDNLFLSAIPLADANGLNVGDFVVSISHVLGAQSTFTSGIVSGLAKTGYSAQNFQSYIQTDAGAGAGLLINLHGELVGLNIAKVAQTDGGARIGFATPVEIAVKIKDQLLEYGTTQRGYLAIQVQNLTRDLANVFNIDYVGGALITNVVAGSSAAQAGVKVGDVIVQADNHSINRGIDLRNVIGSQFSGDPIQLTILRDGEQYVLPALLESSSPVARMDSMIHYQLEGATFSELANPASVGENSPIKAVKNSPGVMVSDVKRGSVAWDHGMREKDLVVSANRSPVKDLGSFRDAIAQKDVLMLNIMRDNKALFLLLK